MSRSNPIIKCSIKQKWKFGWFISQSPQGVGLCVWEEWTRTYEMPWFGLLSLCKIIINSSTYHPITIIRDWTIDMNLHFILSCLIQHIWSLPESVLITADDRFNNRLYTKLESWYTNGMQHQLTIFMQLLTRIQQQLNQMLWHMLRLNWSALTLDSFQWQSFAQTSKLIPEYIITDVFEIRHQCSHWLKSLQPQGSSCSNGACATRLLVHWVKVGECFAVGDLLSLLLLEHKFLQISRQLAHQMASLATHFQHKVRGWHAPVFRRPCGVSSYASPLRCLLHNGNMQNLTVACVGVTCCMEVGLAAIWWALCMVTTGALHLLHGRDHLVKVC